MGLFKKRLKYTIVRIKKKDIPDGLWVRCEKCLKIIFKKTLLENLKVCPHCNYHFPLTAYERIDLLIDKGTFQEYDKVLAPLDPLNFKGPKSYIEKLSQDQQKTGLKDAAVTGRGKLNGKDIVIGVTDSRFIMGSMGSVVGEKITRIAEKALEFKIPLIIVSGSGGGARMYEGMLSLMQMAKTSAVLSKLHSERIPYISVLTHPTMAGVMASFAGLGDIIIAEPDSLIGFTGPRVIEQTIKQKLPPGFQRSEFMLEHGLIDIVVERKELKRVISLILEYLA